MTDSNADAGTAPAGATDTSPADTSTDVTTTTEAKPEVDWKAKAREWEKRAKENSSAAQRLAELEQSQMTESQKLAERLTQAEQAAAAAQAEALRFRIAAKFEITDEDAETFLTGADEEALTRQATRLAALKKQPDPQPTGPGPRPDLSQGARSDVPLNGDPLLRDIQTKLGLG